MPEPKISISSKRLLSSISLEEAKVSHSTEMMNDEQLISHALKEDPKKEWEWFFNAITNHFVRMQFVLLGQKKLHKIWFPTFWFILWSKALFEGKHFHSLLFIPVGKKSRL